MRHALARRIGRGCFRAFVRPNHVTFTPEPSDDSPGQDSGFLPGTSPSDPLSP
jgi:hypothetical protein